MKLYEVTVLDTIGRPMSEIYKEAETLAKTHFNYEGPFTLNLAWSGSRAEDTEVFVYNFNVIKKS